MTDALAQWFANNLSGFAASEVIVFLVSMIPILELRGGLIVASILQVDMWRAIPICILGNLIPVPFILLLINKIFALLKKHTKKLGALVTKLETKSLNRSEKIQKYEFWGLALFVGIPLPGTGAWTGALIAALLGIKFKKALPAIFLGLLMATVIMTIISYGIPALFG